MARKRSARQNRRERRAATRAVAPSSQAPSSQVPASQAQAESEIADIPRSGAPGGGGGPLGALPRGDAPAALGLALLAALVYFPALSGEFIWDDVIVTEESIIHRWSGLWDIWFSPGAITREPHFWPVVYTTFWLEHKLWGLAPLGYHAVNVLLHAANVLLLWRLLAKLAVPGALAIAAVFAVHPVHVESVAWIIERKDVLSALFYLGAVLAWVRFTEAPHPGRYCLALGLFTLGLLSKSIVVTLPVALLLWHWWKKGEVTRLDAIRLAPFFLVGLCITVADLAFYTSQRSHAFGFSAAERVLIAARALWFYAGKLLWPTDLAVIHPRWAISAGDPLGWTYLAAAAGLAALLWRLRHRLGRGPFAGAAFFAVTLSPVLGFVDYGYMKFSFVADRFQYLAGIGVMAVLVGGAVRGAGRLPDALRRAATGAFVVVLAALGTLTWQQAGVYRSELGFWSHIVSLNPQARNAHRKLGAALVNAGRLEEGHAAALVAVELRPEDYRAHATLASALKAMRRFAEADEHLARALALNPRDKAARRNMADLRLQQGRYGEAAELFDKAVALDASDTDALAGLATALTGMKRYDAALDAADRALELFPESAKASRLHFLAAGALRALGRLDAAEQRLVRAVELDAADAVPLADLSNLRFAQQRFDEAREYLRRAIELAPGDASVLNYVAEALKRQGRNEEAIESYRAALDLLPAFAIAHSGLGDALFRLARYEEAIESLERAIALDAPPDTATASLVLMGRAAARLGRSDEAAAYYERAVELGPRNPAGLNRLASARFRDRRYEEALALYRTVLEVRPDSARTHSNVGATLYILGRPEEARRSFERALTLDPTLELARSGIERLNRSPRPESP